MRVKERVENIQLGKGVRLGKNAVLTGTVTVGEQSSIWHNVVVRGDVEAITIGKQCNIQDNTVMHGQLGKYGVKLGDRVSVGHSCILHGCEIASDSFIGMGAMVMNGVYIGPNVMVAAGSLIPEGTQIREENVLVMGRPGKIVRPLKEKEIQMIKGTPERYIDYAEQWLPPCTEADATGPSTEEE